MYLYKMLVSKKRIVASECIGILFQNDPFTILKCQTIISEMLQLLKLTSVGGTLQMMIESQVSFDCLANCKHIYENVIMIKVVYN